MSLEKSMNCVHCGKLVDFSFRFCPQCGKALFVDLSRQDLTADQFLDVLNSVYNLIITPDLRERDSYFHPLSRKLIHRRFAIEHELELDASTRFQWLKKSSPISGSDSIDAIKMRIDCRSSNTMTGYASRVAEELIVKMKSPPISGKEVEFGIASFERENCAEHVVKEISRRLTDKSDERRILFIFHLQDNNKHTNYFLDELLWERWFDTVLKTNTEMTVERYKPYVTPKTDMLAEEVLNDMVFGYCTKLSESLFPIANYKSP